MNRTKFLERFESAKPVRHRRRKLTQSQVDQIRALSAKASRATLAQRFNVAKSTIIDIVRGRTWAS